MSWVKGRFSGTTNILGDKVKVDVDVDPLVYMVGLGYKF